ncbi:MAG: TDT family transporter [Aeromonas sp.]
MLAFVQKKLATLPTPMAGLALGIASLGWCLENLGLFAGHAQATGAVLAAALLLFLTGKFILHPRLLADDLAHPVVGSVVPTFAMACMVVAKALSLSHPSAGIGLWLGAIALHCLFLVTFIYHRARNFALHHMVPSWFVPPVGVIVAAVAYPNAPEWLWLADGLLLFGLCAYGVMLPLMLYRLIFAAEVADGAKPTIAILAAPASLSLAGYLTITPAPSLLLVAVLLGIALLMTGIIYLSLLKLLRLPFSPGYAAFTFPLVISATALFKVEHLVRALASDVSPAQHAQILHYSSQIHSLALIELALASVIVSYVALRYAYFLLAPRA